MDAYSFVFNFLNRHLVLWYVLCTVMSVLLEDDEFQTDCLYGKTHTYVKPKFSSFFFSFFPSVRV